MNPQAHHDAAQGDRNDHALEQQGDQGRDEQMRRALQIGLPGDRARERKGVEREHVEEREHAVLIQQQEAQENHGARQQMGDIAVERTHRETFETNSRIVPSSPSMSAMPRNSGTRNTRILAMAVSNSTRRNASAASFRAQARSPAA